MTWPAFALLGGSDYATQFGAVEAAHQQSIDILVGDYEQRRQQRLSHPVDDFLFVYYSYRPNQLRRWHPGLGIELPGDAPQANWRGYRRTNSGVTADPGALPLGLVAGIATLLRATASRPPMLGCFGLHEWAMVYRRDDERRHSSWPLRLSPSGTDEVVEGHRLRCTHIDAQRFFTDEALPRRETPVTRDMQVDFEQPGCLHAGMDLYKWAYRLAPLTSSALVLDCFRLAREIRYVDMQASPYDFTDLGLTPIAIETAAGKSEYAKAQANFAERAAPLRQAVAELCDQALAMRSSP